MPRLCQWRDIAQPGQEPEDLLKLSDETRGILDEHSLRPLWEVEDDFGTTIDDIEEDVPIADLPPGFQCRVAVPINTGFGNAISNTIYVGVQTVSPGETAPTHRHSANALRFTIDGNKQMKTVVAGEEFPMRDNDLITTPPVGVARPR